jgi:Flp pilus assembly protein TadG
MKTPVIRKPGSSASLGSCSRRREHGVTMILVALAMVAIIAMAALSIDVITLYLAREEAQRAADAAALAAARVISISGLTGDPADTLTFWQTVCNGSTSPASMAATAVATQSAVSGTSAGVLVTYSSSTTSSSDCVSVGPPFAVNPLVTVKVTRTGLPTFFSRIWGNTGNTVSASATAEAFNPSASDANINGGNSGSVTPVQPSCVKPWMVPNIDPLNPALCVPGGCNGFVTVADGSIQNPGVRPVKPAGVIGETFNLFADCAPGSPCTLVPPGGTLPLAPQANIPATTTGFAGGNAPNPPNLEYLPGQTSYSSVAVPSCSVSTGLVADYEPAVAGCDQSTSYQCGVQSSVAVSPANAVDRTENPGGGTGDTATGVACLINQSTGQDTINTLSYPYQITAGSGNPNAALNGKVISSSSSIMSFPIYDSGGTTDFSVNPTNVTIVGFLQVFVNSVDGSGNLNVTVLNVAGCGNNATNRAVTGSSPVPIRLITPP